MPADDIQIKKLEQENFRLRRAVEELSVLNDIATAINSTLTMSQIVDLIVHKCVKNVHVEQAVVMILDGKKGGAPFQTMVRKADTTTEVLPYRLDTHLGGWMLINKKPLLVTDINTDERFTGIGTEIPIKSLLSVPLVAKGKMIGALTVFNKKNKEVFTEDDQRLLTIIATQSAQVIENARLLGEEQILMRLQEEMRMANQIQTNLLPDKAPDFKGYDIAGASIPAKDVGGDYYDFLPIDDTHLAFAVGDVTGKGLPAALIMANIQATIRSQTLANYPVSEKIKNANTLMHKSTDSGKFVSLFYAIIDSQKHEMIYCNAGHDTPFLYKNKALARRLTKGGLVLGFVDSFDYEEESIGFNPGDCLAIYSDGVSEAMNSNEDEFGEERLQKLILDNIDLPSAEIIKKTISEIKAHAKDVPQSDDITLVIVKRV